MDEALLCGRLAVDLDGAFEELVLAHQDRLYSIALRIVGDSRDAEEVAQDALVRAYRALAVYEAPRIRSLRLRGWLAAIVVNLARNRATRHRQPSSVPLHGADAETRSPADTLASSDVATQPLDAVVRAETAERWAVLVRALPERYRIPLVLRHVDGLSFAEMAEALHRPEGTLKAQVHRAIAMLRTAHADEIQMDPLVRAPVLAAQEMTA